MFIIKMANHDGNHRCLIEKNVPIALILPCILRDGAESLGIEHQLFMAGFSLTSHSTKELLGSPIKLLPDLFTLEYVYEIGSSCVGTRSTNSYEQQQQQHASQLLALTSFIFQVYLERYRRSPQTRSKKKSGASVEQSVDDDDT